ncbi:MAG TPA: SCO family protein [Candidatus Saccharimonadales bacterium]|nr:SCO family protein [Candidatus Saccharimonadales bacterium]
MISKFLNKRLWRPSAVLLWFFFPGVLSAHEQDPPSNFLKTAAAVNVKTPEFVLVNQDNQRFESSRLRGKVIVLNFIFTTCTDVCPIFTANLAALQRKLNDRHGTDLFFVSITTDPEIDSAKVLKGYAGRYRADLKNWAFLTGSEADLKAVWTGFGIRVINKGRGLVQHTSLTTVIDQGGIRRANYLGEKWQLKDLERDVLAWLDKKP